jgi:hypothetical protein
MDSLNKIKVAELDQLKTTVDSLLKSQEKDIKRLSKELKAKESELISNLSSEDAHTYSRLYSYSATSDQFIADLGSDDVIALYGSCKCLDRMINRLKTQHLNCTIKSTLEIAVAKKSLKIYQNI